MLSTHSQENEVSPGEVKHLLCEPGGGTVLLCPWTVSEAETTFRQHCLYLLPVPQRQGSLRPVF